MFEKAGRRAVFFAAGILVFAVNLGRILFAPLLAPLERAFGVGPAVVGSLVTVVWLGSAAPRIPTGYLLTRISRPTVLVWNGVFLVLAAILTATAPSLPVVFVGAFLLGISSGIHFIAGIPFVSELFPEDVGAAVGIHGGASQAAAVLAPLAVPWLLRYTDWRAPFWILAGIALLGTTVLALVAQRADLPDAGAADRDLPAAARAQWRLILTGVSALGVIGFVWNAVFNFYVKYLVATKGFSESLGGTMLTVAFAAGLLAFVLTGRIADRLPQVPLLLGIGAAFATSLLVLTIVESLVAVAVTSAVLGYAIHSAFPVVDTYLLSSLPDHHRASAYAVYGGVVLVIQALGGVVLGTLLDRGVAYDTVFRVFVVLIGMALLGLGTLHRQGVLPRSGSAGSPIEDT